MGGIKLEDHIGEKYGCLTITGIDRERMKQDKNSVSYVFADCDCGCQGKSYNFNKLKRGETKSCGHLKKQLGQRKFNQFDMNGECGIIYTSDGTAFKFDKEDYHYLEGKYWYKDDYGYLTHAYTINSESKYIRFHRLIMGEPNNMYVDHINQDKSDNRKNNLRLCKHKENDRNNGLYVTNTSGVTGVHWDKSRELWCARITYNYKSIYLGRYESRDEAIRARLLGEIKYFKEYAPQKDLFKQYLTAEEIGGFYNEIQTDECA